MKQKVLLKEKQAAAFKIRNLSKHKVAFSTPFLWHFIALTTSLTHPSCFSPQVQFVGSTSTGEAQEQPSYLFDDEQGTNKQQLKLLPVSRDSSTALPHALPGFWGSSYDSWPLGETQTRTWHPHNHHGVGMVNADQRTFLINYGKTLLL